MYKSMPFQTFNKVIDICLILIKPHYPSHVTDINDKEKIYL